MADEVDKSVATVNTKNLGDAPAQAMGMLFQSIAADMARANQNATANQQAMNVIQQAGVTMAVNKLLNMDPAEAISVLKGISGNDLAQQLAGLAAGIANSGQAVKAAAITPPETGGA